jgi:lysophospholipid acyltransferase (LPLAT)-like uncharacterized protein
VKRETRLGGFSLRQRIALALIPPLARGLLLLLGRTLRYECSWEAPHDARSDRPPEGAICPFWHRSLLLAGYFYRHSNVTVIISSSFDGELIARTLQGLGYGVVRGSSTHGGRHALLEMQALGESFKAFTADGPKGPLCVAKPGPVLLARTTGDPICCFNLAARQAWELGSWDRLLIPKPFTRIHIRWSRRIDVPADADPKQMSHFHQQMQAALERAQTEALRRVSRNSDLRFQI